MARRTRATAREATGGHGDGRVHVVTATIGRREHSPDCRGGGG